MNYRKEVRSLIEKLVGDLKEEEALIETLKRKLTKKEFKVFVAQGNGLSKEDIAKEVRIELDRVEEVLKALKKKINQEKIKKELCE
ncbi:MAG: hypothetical protein HRT41_14900 [Campylobacteraceae bacterium]|nr:hypothetical protein [Campylobacteraceae bacterium]